MLAVQMKKGTEPFCYEHLTEMMPYGDDLPKVKTGTAYVCSVWDCLVSYNTLDGYFIAVKEGDRVEQSTTPSIRCPSDGMPMYLAEIRPEQKRYRLWRCPQCGMSVTNLESGEASRLRKN